MTFSVGNAGEHRLLLTSLLQRSRYHLANRARVNEAEIIEGKQEISSPFYEGVEAGAVLIGRATPAGGPSRGAAPRCARLHAVFDTLGTRPTEAMLAREERLRSLAALALEARGDAA